MPARSGDPAPADRWLLAGCLLALLLLGAGLGVLGAFLVPLRLAGHVEGLSVVLAVAGNLTAGLLGGRGTGSLAGAVAPALGWIAVVLLAGSTTSGGGLVVPGQIPADPGVGWVGVLFYIGGIVAALVPPVLFVRFTPSRRPPTRTG